MKQHYRQFLTVGLVALLSLIAACSSSGATSSGSSSLSKATSSGASSSGTASGLPAGFQGPYLTPVNIYPPWGYEDSAGNIQGIAVDFPEAIAKTLGTSTSLEVNSFENQITGVESGKYPWVIGAELTAVREQQYDMVPLLADSSSFAVLANANPIGDSMMDVCGLTVGLIAGTSQIPTLTALSAQCKAAGKGAVTLDTYNDRPTMDLALKSGRINAETVATDTLAYTVKTQPGFIKGTGPIYNYTLECVLTKKGTGFAQSVANAINKMIANGTYAALLAKWGLTSGALTEATVNPNPSSPSSWHLRSKS